MKAKNKVVKAKSVSLPVIATSVEVKTVLPMQPEEDQFNAYIWVICNVHNLQAKQEQEGFVVRSNQDVNKNYYWLCKPR